MIIKVLSAIPSAGKTRAILEHIKDTNQKAFVASISRELNQQSYNYYKDHLNGEAILIDSDHCSSKKTVNDVIKGAIKSNRVIFITHAALFNFTRFSKVKDFNLYIDEVPDLITFKQFTFASNSNLILDYCNPIGEGNFTLELKETRIRELKNKALEGYDLKDDISAMVFPVYKSLLTGIPVKAINTKGKLEVQFIEDRSCKEWENFKTVTIACNNLYHTFTGMVMQKINNWTFIESPLDSKLEYTKFMNSKRVKIHVMYDKDWSKYASNKPNGTMTNFTLMCDTVKNNSKEFIYTVNKSRGKISGGVYVSYNPHGLNSYKMFTDAFVAFSFNPQPWQIPLLESLALSFDLDKKTFVDAFIVEKYLEPAFQLCSRTDIRTKSSDKPVNLFVPDQRCAEYIKRFVPHATISHDLMITDEVKEKKKQARKKRDTFDNLYGFSQKEKQRFAHVRLKFKKEHDRLPDVHVLSDHVFVKDWLEKTRSKNK